MRDSIVQCEAYLVEDHNITSEYHDAGFNFEHSTEIIPYVSIFGELSRNLIINQYR